MDEGDSPGVATATIYGSDVAPFSRGVPGGGLDVGDVRANGGCEGVGDVRPPGGGLHVVDVRALKALEGIAKRRRAYRMSKGALTVKMPRPQV